MIKARIFQDLFKRYRRPGDLVFAVLFLIFSLVLLIVIDGQVTWADRTKLLAQPAFAPWVAVVCMVVFGTLHLISSVVSPKLDGRWLEVGFWVRSCEYAIWFMAYVLVVPRLGYLPGTVVFTTVLTYRIGYRSGRMLISAALFGIAVVVVFKTFLQVKVPGGAIYEFLPTAARSFMLTYF